MLEQPEADHHRRLVAGPGRDQAADQLLEGRAIAPVAEVEHRRLGLVRQDDPEPAKDLVDVERFGGRAGRRRGFVGAHDAQDGANRKPKRRLRSISAGPSPRAELS